MYTVQKIKNIISFRFFELIVNILFDHVTSRLQIVVV